MAMSSRVYPFFPRRGHKHPPTPRERPNLHLCFQRCRFTAPHAKRPYVAPYAIGPLFLLPTPPSPHCTIKVPKNYSLWQPPVVISDERPRAQNPSRAQRRLNVLTPGYLEGMVVQGPLITLVGLRHAISLLHTLEAPLLIITSHSTIQTSCFVRPLIIYRNKRKTHLRHGYQ